MEVMESGEGISHNVQVTVCLSMDTCNNYTITTCLINTMS